MMSGSHTRRLAAPLLLLLALAGCATLPPVRSLSPEQQATAERQQVAREAALRTQVEWSLAGRIAVSHDGDGGSGRIDWRQDRAGYHVALSAPVTRQSWRLSVDGATGAARLEGLEGGPRTGADAVLLLREATGWDVPVNALGDWVRGLRSPALGAAVIQYGHDLRPARLAQGGWDIAYTWGENSAERPARIDARRGDSRVRLIVDEWGGAGSPASQ